MRLVLAPFLCALLVACAAPVVEPPADRPATDPPATDPSTDPPATDPPADPPPPAYPDGAAGTKQGLVFPDVEIEGYREGTGEWTKLAMRDYYDPDGKKGITGVYVIVAAEWCGVCQQEAARLPKEYPAWRARGARFLQVLGQDSGGKPAYKAVVDRWQTRFHLGLDVGADPKLDFMPKGATGFPTCFVIDPRTMKIVRVLPGVTSDGSIPGLEQVVTRNGG